MLPALGGLAIASALTANEGHTRWAAKEIKRLQSLEGPRYAVAHALFEAATALRIVNRAEDAERFLKTATGFSRLHGFYEILYKADSLNELVRPRIELGVDARNVAREIAEMEPRHLPPHVRVENVASSIA